MDAEAASAAPVEHDGFVLSGSTPSDVVKESLKAPDAPEGEDAIAKAASELGKRGGKAAAEARKAKPAEKPAVVEAEAAEPEAEPEPDKRGNPRHDPKARMLEATRKEADAKRRAAAAEERAERLEREVADIKRRLTPEQPRQEAPAADEDAEPQEDQFESYKDYVKAAARYEFKQERKQEQARMQREALAHGVASAITEARTQFRSRIDAAEKETPGVWERISDDIKTLDPTHDLPRGTEPDGSNFLADELLTSEHGPALMVHLTDHPDDLQRIAALPSRRAVLWEVARLVTRMEAVTTATSSTPSVSKAHPPVRPVAGAPTAASGEYYRQGEDFDEWYRRNNPSKKRA